MNLIFANNNYYLKGGADKVFFDEIRLLESQKHTVIPFAMHNSLNKKIPYSSYFPSGISYDNTGLVEKIKTAPKIIYSLDAKRQFHRLLSSVNVDIIHAHNIYGRLTSSIVDAAKIMKKPIVLTLHDYKLVCPSYLMLNHGTTCEKCKGAHYYHCFVTRCHRDSFVASFIYSLESYFNSVLRKYDWIRYLICPSNFIKEKFIEMGMPEDKLKIVYNLLDCTDFAPNYDGGKYLLYAGKLTKEKGVMTLLKAVTGLDLSLKIVGDGPLRSEYEGYVRENQLNNVTFEGFKSGEELKSYFRYAAFHIVPSEWYENAPMTVIEAFAYGKPVIGGRIGGIPEMVLEGETGFLFTPGDHDELREKISYLAYNPSKIAEMGRKARKRVEAEHNPHIHYKRLRNVYEAAIRL